MWKPVSGHRFSLSNTVCVHNYAVVPAVVCLAAWVCLYLRHCRPRSRALRWHVRTATVSLSWNFQLCCSLRVSVWYAHNCNFVCKWVFLYVLRSQGTCIILILSLTYVLYVVSLNMRYLVFLCCAVLCCARECFPHSLALSERWVCGVEDSHIHDFPVYKAKGEVYFDWHPH